ncbi:MAG TPA: hypothetical protein VFE65_12565 [Pseudonocardia sp.]|nr:hypothetical protein [Pseudonocardia sp.]
MFDTNYFETYNRNDVELVSLREAPLPEITAKGIQVGDREHEIDIIVFAIGWDGMTGSLSRVDIPGTRRKTAYKEVGRGSPHLFGLSSAGLPKRIGPTGLIAKIGLEVMTPVRIATFASS